MTNEWAGLLSEGEVILWQGAPQVRFRFDWETPLEPLIYITFMFFSVYAVLKNPMTADPTWWVGPIIFALVCLVFFGMGFYGFFLSHFWTAYKLRNTHYTLTNKRAFIGTFDVIKGKRLENYPITEATVLSLREGKLATIDFATKTVSSGDSTHEVSISFEDLTDGRDAYALMRKIQEGTA